MSGHQAPLPGFPPIGQYEVEPGPGDAGYQPPDPAVEYDDGLPTYAEADEPEQIVLVLDDPEDDSDAGDSEGEAEDAAAPAETDSDVEAEAGLDGDFPEAEGDDADV